MPEERMRLDLRTHLVSTTMTITTQPTPVYIISRKASRREDTDRPTGAQCAEWQRCKKNKKAAPPPPHHHPSPLRQDTRLFGACLLYSCTHP